jgi:SAM-dependent methyltransferase
LLLQYLRARGVDGQYFGIDNDSIKISMARATAARNGLQRARFEVCDPAMNFPVHRGSVVLLDVLQFFERDAREALIANVAKSITPQGKLVIRSGLEDSSWRASVSRAGDRFAYFANWMRTSPKSQPSRDELTRQLQLHGLKAQFQPLWGYTPFNNWLVVASRPEGSG